MNQEDFHLEEYKEAIGMYKAEFQVWTQTTTTLGVVNITGFAVGTQKAGLFLVSAFVSILILIGYAAARRYLAAIAYRAIVIEQMYGNGAESFISSMISALYSAQFLKSAKELSNIDDLTTRTLLLRKLGGSLSKKGVFLLMFVVLSQISLIPILMYSFGWSFA